MNEKLNNSIKEYIDRPLRRSFGLGAGWGVFIAFLAECAILSFLSPYFLKPDNLFNILKSMSYIGIASVGMTMLIISGGLDLSVGSMIGLGGMVMAFLTEVLGINLFIAVFAGLSTGIVVGSFMATLVNKLRINSFIVTLAMLSIVRGFTFLISRGSNIFIRAKSILFLGKGYIGRIPFSVILMVIIVIAGSLFLKFTVLGRQIYAVGGNERAARLAGIQVHKVRMITFIICSTLAAFAGIVLAGLSGSGEMTAGMGKELDIIAAVIIGGTSLFGGKGTIIGSLIGAAIMAVLRNGFILVGLSYEVQIISIGVVIILAVVLDSMRTKRR